MDAALNRWKFRASAMAPDLPPEAAENAARVMMKLEAAFAPLLSELEAELEPAYVFLIPEPPAS
jgi:hypothetical protein